MNCIKKISTLVFTYMISTTLVMAQHTNASVQSDINNIFAQINNVNEYQKINKAENSCESVDKKELIKKIDKRIAKAKRNNESLDKSIEMETAKYLKIQKRHKKVVKRILKRKRRIRKALKKARKSNPELTRSEFVSGLKRSIATEEIEKGKMEISRLLVNAGSMENYLEFMKEGLLKCDEASINSNAGIIYLIIFVGVPVLAILASLFALIFGLFNLALWLFVGALGILIIFFLIGNLSSKLYVTDEEQV